jgi:hypothetical protein
LFPRPAARFSFRIFQAVLVLTICCGTPRAAEAEWLLTPFLGLKFKGDTTLVDLEGGAKKTSTAIGVSAMLLQDGILGVEGDFAYLPGFLGSRSVVVDSSRVFTLTGNVVVTTPRRLTRESLRPFVVAGVGLMDARIRGQRGLLVSKMDELALGLGVGALGALSDATSVRFEVRRFQNLTSGEAVGESLGDTRLRFWRADIGLAFRY